MEIVDKLVAPILATYGGTAPTIAGWHRPNGSYSNPGKVHLRRSCQAASSKSVEIALIDRQLPLLCKLCSGPAAVDGETRQRIADRAVLSASADLAAKLGDGSIGQRRYCPGLTFEGLLDMAASYSRTHQSVADALAAIAQPGCVVESPLLRGTLRRLAEQAMASRGAQLCVPYEPFRVLGSSRSDAAKFFGRLSANVSNGFSFDDSVTFAVEAARTDEVTVDNLPDELVFDRADFDTTAEWLRAERVDACGRAAAELTAQVHATVYAMVTRPQLVVVSAGSTPGQLDESAAASGWDLITAVRGLERFMIVPEPLLALMPPTVRVIDVDTSDPAVDDALRYRGATVLRVAVTLQDDSESLSQAEAFRAAALVATQGATD